MAYAVQHVHIKTRDPKTTAQFYIDNFAATLKAEIPGRGLRLDLHGLQLNVTSLISSQNHEQHYGIEHIALETIRSLLKRTSSNPGAIRSGVSLR